MRDVINTFKKIQSTSSLNEKMAIINANKNNSLFKKCLKFLLDNDSVTGISSKKIHKKVGPSSELAPYYLSGSSEFTDVMQYLNKNNTGKDDDIYEIQCFLSGHENDREFYESMITKSLKLGVDAKTVNKCIPGLIHTFDVMLGTPIDKVKIKENEKIYISRKLNGCRCSFIGDKCMTRQAKEYKGLEHIIMDLQRLVGNNVFVDGELIYKNPEGLSDSEAFQKGTGIAMSKDLDKTSLKFVAFDMFPLDEFWNGRSNNTYEIRRRDLLKLKDRIDLLRIENVEVVPMYYTGHDHSKIWEWLDYAENHDWEGIMINLDTPYECKRTKSLIKVKKFFSCDIRCTGVEEGTGRNKNTLGALICNYKGNEVQVGSGFTDMDRKRFWLHPEEVIGKIILVKYKEETKNKNGGTSIQFPVFQGVRYDKDTESYI